MDDARRRERWGEQTGILSCKKTNQYGIKLKLAKDGRAGPPTCGTAGQSLIGRYNVGNILMCLTKSQSVNAHQPLTLCTLCTYYTLDDVVK